MKRLNGVIYMKGTPGEVLTDAILRIKDIKNIVLMVEFNDETNAVAYNDMQNGYEVIGRLFAMIEHIREQQKSCGGVG